MKIYIVRHGETDYNAQGLIQGRTDNPLNAQGIKQAVEMVGTFFLDKKIDYTITSPLLRAHQTLDYIMQQNNINTKVHIDERFSERNFGVLEGQHVQKFHQCPDLSMLPGYEQDPELQARVMSALNDVVKLSAHNVLIVCHSHVMKAILIALLGEKFDYTYQLKNCAIMELDFIDQQFYFRTIH